MDYLEKYIKNSWDKVPQEFKDRIDDYQLILGQDKNDIEYTNKVVFYRGFFEKQFQKIVDKEMVKQLSFKFGFNEDEAQTLLDILNKIAK